MPEVPLRTYFVWVPMLPEDSHAAAGSAAERFTDPRAAHYWDGKRRLSARMAIALAIDAKTGLVPGDAAPFAWDVYLAYRTGNGDITRPDFWMHQLAVERVPRFEATEWRRQIAEMLTNIDP